MIAKYNKDSYIDIDAILAIIGYYDDKDNDNWITNIAVNGAGWITINGQAGKNIMDAYLWKRNTSIYDMISDSKTYRKQVSA